MRGRARYPPVIDTFDTGDRSRLDASTVMRWTFSRRERDELPSSLPSFVASQHGTPWVIDLEEREGEKEQ